MLYIIKYFRESFYITSDVNYFINTLVFIFVLIIFTTSGFIFYKGYNVIIFPEGTRQPAHKIGEIKPGIFFIQSILKKPVYPIFINSGNVWPKNSFIMKQEDIHIKSLKPIEHGLNKNIFKKKLKKAYEKYNNEVK